MTTFLSWELAPAAGSAAGRFAIAGLRRNIHIKRPTRSPLQVSSDNPPGRCLVHCSIQQISLTSINYTVHNRPAGTPLLVLTSSRTQKLEYNERWLRHRCDVRASLYPVSVTRISKLHSYLKASLVSQSFSRIELRSAAGRQHPKHHAHRHRNTEGHHHRCKRNGNVR